VPNAAAEHIIAFLRRAPRRAARQIVCVSNFSNTMKKDYRLAVPSPGSYRVILNTDAIVYNGSGAVELDVIRATAEPRYARPYSALIDLPPLSTIWLEVPPAPASAEEMVTKT